MQAAIIGVPNAGKSMLTNMLVGQKVGRPQRPLVRLRWCMRARALAPRPMAVRSQCTWRTCKQSEAPVCGTSDTWHSHIQHARNSVALPLKHERAACPPV